MARRQDDRSDQAMRERALEAVALMRREDLSLDAAASRVGTHPAVVILYANQALKKVGDEYEALPSDKLERGLAFPTTTGSATVVVGSSEDATAIGEYFNAVRSYVRTGDASKLADFAGQSVTDVDGKQWPFITDPRVLKRLGNAGVLSFADLYREVK